MKNKIKNLLKGNKQPFPTAPVPRTEAEINRVYTELCAQAGQTQYNISFLNKRLEAINAQIKDIDMEMHARKNIDKTAAEEAVKTQTAKNTAVSEGA